MVVGRIPHLLESDLLVFTSVIAIGTPVPRAPALLLGE